MLDASQPRAGRTRLIRGALNALGILLAFGWLFLSVSCSCIVAPCDCESYLQRLIVDSESTLLRAAIVAFGITSTVLWVRTRWMRNMFLGLLLLGMLLITTGITYTYLGIPTIYVLVGYCLLLLAPTRTTAPRRG